MQHTTGVKKDLLFYSSYCDYCNEVLATLNQQQIAHEFMLICVDNNKFKLPSFVDRVPIIYTKDHELVYDENIIRYIQAVYPSPAVEDISPFSLQQTNYSNQFSYLEEEMPELQNKGYTMLGYDQRISVPEGEENTTKKAKVDSSVFDRYVQERNADIEACKKKMSKENGMYT